MIRKVFISYSSKDKIIVKKLTNVLDEKGIEYCMDRINIRWGEFIKQRIQEGIVECDAVIVVVTKDSIHSEWVPLEIGFALGKEKLILPFLKGRSLDIPDYLKGLKYNKSFNEVEDFFRYIDKQNSEKELRILRALFKEEGGRSLYYYRTAYYIPAITTLIEKKFIYLKNENDKYFLTEQIGKKYVSEYLKEVLKIKGKIDSPPKLSDKERRILLGLVGEKEGRGMYAYQKNIYYTPTLKSLRTKGYIYLENRKYYLSPPGQDIIKRYIQYYLI